MQPSFMQPSFFADEAPSSIPPWEIDDLKNRKIAKVVFPTGYDAALDYLVPKHLAAQIEPGMRVLVPLGKSNRPIIGYCIGIQPWGLAETNVRLKPIQSLLDEHRLLDDKMLELTRWIAQYYLCPIGQVLEAILPAGVRSHAGTRLTTVLYVPSPTGGGLNNIPSPPGGELNNVPSPLGGRARVGANLVNASAPTLTLPPRGEGTFHSPPSEGCPKGGVVSPEGAGGGLPPLTPKQLHVLQTLRQSPEPLTTQELQRAAKCSAVPINALRQLGLIRTKTMRRQTAGQAEIEKPKEPVPTYLLNEDQKRVLTEIVNPIEQRRHETFLLHGVTGSGKTEVYIQAIQAVVKRKKQAIVLVPEISLTPQTVGRFKSRFPSVAVLHSHLTDAERHRQWSNIVSGEVQVVVGARSAVFAPLPRLGLIVIDEEHENSFKQDCAPRYHARDVARKRAELENIPLILGSATPGLETWFAATFVPPSSGKDLNNVLSLPGRGINNVPSPPGGRVRVGANLVNASAPTLALPPRGEGTHNNPPPRRFETEPRRDETEPGRDGTENGRECKLLSLPHRVNNLQLPNVEIVDLREEVRMQRTRGAIHRQLHQAIHEALIDKGQIILLLNRRGFSTQIQCPACGEPVKCPNCDVSLTHHKTEEIALCHYCDYQIPVPNECPKCKFPNIRLLGFGTQKLELEVKARFPGASVLRMDTDTMQGPGAHERALSQFRSGKVQILLGTQMIAKGLDFPNVTLVGVINADTALHLPDFRAPERTFHLITQVAGRTGRGERGGRVIIQTFNPDHPAIQSASKHDYRAFVRQELPLRKMLGYPPYSRMIRIVVRGENEANTLEFAKFYAEQLRSAFGKDRDKFTLLGPAPAPFAKLRSFYRFHIHLRSSQFDLLRETVRSVSQSLKTPAEVQWIIDVDPADML